MSVEQEDVCPVDDAARRARRSTTTSARWARRSATRSGARSAAPRPSGEVRLDDSRGPAGGPAGLHRPPPAPLGRPRPVPRHARRRRRAGCSSGACSSCSERPAPLRLAFLTVGGRRIAAGISFETADVDLLLQRRRGPRRPRAVAGRADGRALHAARPRARDRPARLPARRRALQVRVGRGRRANPARARPTNGQPMTPSGGYNPCLAPGPAARRAAPGAHPRRPGPRDRHQRRRAGARLQPRLAHGPRRATTSRSSRSRRAAPSASSSGSGSR